MYDLTNGKLREQVLFSRKNKDISLIKCIQKVRKFHGKNSISTSYIYNDYSPRSFYYVHRHDEGEFLKSGGIIYDKDNVWYMCSPWFNSDEFNSLGLCSIKIKD